MRIRCYADRQKNSSVIMIRWDGKYRNGVLEHVAERSSAWLYPASSAIDFTMKLGALPI